MIDNTVLVIGNGESRKNINLQSVIGKIVTVGCNAVHRDTIVDHLVCADHRMIKEAIADINTRETLIYVRPEWYYTFKKLMKRKNIRTMPEIPYLSHSRYDDPRNWGSGTYAHLVAANLELSTVYMLGFDLYGRNHLVNNIYKDTPNYSQSLSHAIDPSYWIYQSAKIFQQFPNKQFVIINNLSWHMPESWKLPNVKFLDIDKFNETLLT
jgi:hypothetical protein